MAINTRVFMSNISTYVKRNKKLVISLFAVTAIALVLGIISAVRAVDGDFERVIRSEVEVATGKIFFLSLLTLAGYYLLILLSGLNGKTVYIAFAPFFLAGFLFGRYSTALVMRYEAFGIVNLILVYLPAFLCTVILSLLCTVAQLEASCSDCDKKTTLRPAFLKLLKYFAVNAAVVFVTFVILGSIIGGVIDITLFD